MENAIENFLRECIDKQPMQSSNNAMKMQIVNEFMYEYISINVSQNRIHII